MHVNKLDGVVDVTVDTLMYVHSEEVSTSEDIAEEITGMCFNYIFF